MSKLENTCLQPGLQHGDPGPDVGEVLGVVSTAGGGDPLPQHVQLVPHGLHLPRQPSLQTSLASHIIHRGLVALTNMLMLNILIFLLLYKQLLR